MKYVLIILILGVLGLVGYRSYAPSSNQSKEAQQEVTPQSEPSTELAPEDETLNLPLPVADGTYNVDTTMSTIKWTAQKKVITTWVDEGTINVKSGEAIVKAGKLESGVLVVDMTSIKVLSTGMGGNQDKLAKHLSSDAFFDVATYPEATLKLTSVNVLDAANGKVQVKADLTLKNKTNPIEFSATVGSADQGATALSGMVVLDRTLWDVRYGSDKFFDNLGDNVIDDNFTLELYIVAKPVSLAN